MTTIIFNIRQNSSNANTAYNTLVSAGLNPFFAKNPTQRTAQLTVEVTEGSDQSDLAKSFLFNADFNRA
jgi:hypothetical protein